MPRVLIVKTSSLGDVIHNLPVISDIYAHLPEAQIDWVVEESFAAIPNLHAGVDAVLPVAVRRWRKSLAKPQTWREIKAARQTLQATHYDAVIDTQGLLKSALIASFARGLHHGQDKNSAREPLAALIYDHKYAIARDQHAVTRNRMLAANALGYAMPATPPDYGIAADRQFAALPSLDLPTDYVVGLHATSRAAKLWPAEHWVALARYLAERDISLLLPWNNEAELARAQSISAQLAQAIVLPKLKLDALAAVLARAKAAVGVDTGLTHLAVALRIPTLAIYTDTEPRLTGVYAGAGALAVNMGGSGRIPAAKEVIHTLQTMLPASI